MTSISSFEGAWDRLDPLFQRCLGEAWHSLRRRGLPVGAVVSLDHRIISAGRNRVYDAPGGEEPLQQTPLAHAEMNAIAAVTGAVDLGASELWTTQSPCAMCRAAIDFTGIAGVHYMATDPSSGELPIRFVASGDTEDVWIVAANGMFLHNVAWVGGSDNPMLGRVQQVEVEVAALAHTLIARRTLIDLAEAGAGVTDALCAIWDQVAAATMTRRKGKESDER